MFKNWCRSQQADNKGTLIIKLYAKRVLIKRRPLPYNNWGKKRVTYEIYHESGSNYTVYETVDGKPSQIGRGSIILLKNQTSDKKKLNRLDLAVVDTTTNINQKPTVVKELKLEKPIKIQVHNYQLNNIEQYTSVELFIEAFEKYESVHGTRIRDRDRTIKYNNNHNYNKNYNNNYNKSATF